MLNDCFLFELAVQITQQSIIFVAHKKLQQMNEVKLYKGDCLRIMQDNINDETIDLTITSPPYDNLRSYKNNIDKSWGEHVWKPIIKELYRITKDGGVVVWVVGDATINGSESGTSFKQALYFKEIGFNLHDTMIFQKETPTWNISSKRYRQHIEYMFVFSKGRPKTFNPIEDQKVKNMKPRMCKSNRNGVPKYELYTPKKEFTTRGNIWKYAVGGKSIDHPAIFPEALANDHILSWSNEGDTIFDPFTGSGTTGKMSVINNRHFIGCDISEDYMLIAENRINEAINNKQLTLF